MRGKKYWTEYGDTVMVVFMLGLSIFVFVSLAFLVITEAIDMGNVRGFCYEMEGKESYADRIGDDHVNCCWTEVSLSDEGYYEGEKCRGYKRK